MKNKTVEIELNGKKYRMFCDINVLQKIQEEFGSLGEYERKLLGVEYKTDENGEKKLIAREPSIRAIIRGLQLMIEEGAVVTETEIKKEELNELVHSQGDFNNMKTIVHEAFSEGFTTKKEEPKKKKWWKRWIPFQRNYR